jgi:phenazine biosynthesis protein phzE
MSGQAGTSLAAEDALRAIASSADPGPFAMIHRPERYGDQFELIRGDVRVLEGLTALEGATSAGPRGVLALLPFRLITEKGYQCADDFSPLLAMNIREHHLVPEATVLRTLPADDPVVRDGSFDVDDEHYADLVRDVIGDEIGHGVGSNFVLRREWSGFLPKWSSRQGLSLFRRLLMSEPSAYWTFYIHTPSGTFLGATPERHVCLHDGAVTMNPISGTYRHPPQGPRIPDVLAFLRDQKEIDELFMVLDEELKMMGRLCADGGRVRGPYLRQMSSVSHTEYLIEGRTQRGIADVLRETMWAPTVIGSPLESACRVIRKYEPSGRGYYSGAIALAGLDPAGGQALDSAILIRSAEITPPGMLRFGVGATLVRHSRPAAEVSETWGKASSLLNAIGASGLASTPGEPGSAPRPRLADQRVIGQALRARNSSLSRFWLTPPGARRHLGGDLDGRRVLIVDAEDTFTAMGRNLLESLGLDVTVRRFDESYEVEDHDVIVAGPGPGNPRDLDDPRIAHLYALVGTLLERRRPMLAVCLGHQVLCALLGLELTRKADPCQGRQRTISYLGRDEVVGFYNTYAAHCSADRFYAVGRGESVEVSRDGATGEVFGLCGRRFASMQFHPASVLTLNGATVLRDAIRRIL